MSLAHFRVTNNEFLKKYPDVVPEQANIIILDSKSAVCMAKNGKYTKHTRHVSRRIHFVRNVEELNMHKKVWCEVSMQLVDTKTKKVKEDELNPILIYDMVRLEYFT